MIQKSQNTDRNNIKIKANVQNLQSFNDTIRCLFKFPVKVGVEESIVNALRIRIYGSAV
jgi:hypothetical protein